MTSWEETLKDIGITGNQAKVYAVCVGLGAKTASELSVYTGLTIPAVSQELEKLQSMGVIKKIPGKIDFYIALTPRIALTGMVAETLQNKLENLKTKIMTSTNNAIESLSQNVATLKSKLNEGSSSYLGEVVVGSSQIVAQLLGSTSESLENLKSEASQQSQNIEGSLQQMIDLHEKDSKETIKNLVEASTESVATFRSDIQEVKDTSERVLKDFIEQTRISITDFQEKLETAVNDAIKTIESRAEDVSGRTVSEVTSLFSDLDYAFDKSVKEIEEINLQPLKTINENSIEISKTAISGIVELIDELGPLTETQTTNIQGMKEAFLNDFRKSLETNRKKIVGFMEEIEGALDTQTIKIRDLILENLTRFQSEISQVMERYTDKIAEIGETSKNAIKQVKTNLSVQEELNAQENQLKTSLEEEVQKAESELKTKLTEIEEESNSLKQKIGSIKDKALKDSRNSLGTLLKNINKAMKKHLDDFVSNFHSESLTLKRNLSANFSDSVAVQKSKMAGFEETFTTALNRIIDIIQFVEDKSGDKKKLSLGKEETEELLSKVTSSKNEIKGLKKELRNSVNGLNENINKVSTNILDALDKSLTYIGESFAKKTEKLIQSLQEEDVKPKESARKAKESAGKGTTDIESGVVSEITNFKTINENNFNAFHSEFEAQIDKQLPDMEKIITDAVSQVASSRDSCLTVFGSIKSGVVEQLDKSSDILESSRSLLEESLENIKQTLANTSTDAQNIITPIKETVSSQTLQQFSEEKARLEENLESAIRESVNDTSQRLDDFHSGLKESLNDYLDKATKLRATAEKNVYSNIDKEFKVLTKQLEEQKGQLEETLTKSKDEIEEKHSKVQKGVEEVTSTLGRDLPSYVEKIKYDLLSTMDRHSRESRDSAEVKLESLAAITDKPFSNIESKLLDFDRKLGLLFEKRHSEIKSKTYEALESLKDSHTAFEETLNTLYSNMEQTLNQKIDEEVSKHQGETSSTVNTTMTSIEENETGSIQALNTFTGEIPERIGEAITNTQDTLKLITRIMKLSEEIEPKPFEDTERVVGKEQILNLLKTLIKNTKSTITILTPTVNDIPIEDLRQIPRQRVTIITDAEGKAPPMPAHIQLKHNPGNVYAFNRDSEEMILAVAAPEPLGIYTVNMELIKLLNQILQDVSARAKKI
nr:helix-turn-helix domain-containing protein [Candidatus Freyarchaeota archaeon]